MDDKSEKNEPANKPAEKPVSLKPLKVEEALSDLLKVKPSREEPENDSEGGSIK